MTDNQPTYITTSTNPQPTSATIGIALHGRRLMLARAAWGLLLIVTLVLVVIAVPLRFNQLTQTVSTNRGLHQLTSDEAQLLTQANISIRAYALYTTGF